MTRETPEQARTRRRWITLAELVAVAGLLIGALTLWLNWSDRREERAEKAATNVSEQRSKSVVTLTGEVVDGGEAVGLTDTAHAISGATVRFPAALGIGVQDAMPGPRVQAEWVADAILKLTDKGADARTGRLPVLVATTWWDGEAKREASAIYDLLWRTDGRVLQGRSFALTGVALRSRGGSAAALERAWAEARPR